ncbi:MAG: peptide ABC transporter substrate-binding protein [Cephaloticoccus sp.]|nr:peptide ABC transporter substrate-binding protein [Cephaloticoccus sp.]MCF7761609.1 peptide ABC transporter substrate-binding protein [Cephaloticoccus sp.]
MTENPGSILRVSQRNEPGDIDPATINLPDELFVLRALSEGLVTPAPDGGPPRPAAAQTWDKSADGLTYTFHLRPGATWSNGEPVTAADFVASYRRILTPATAAPKAELLFAVQGAEDYLHGRLTDFAQVGFQALDPLTLIVKLTNPTPQFLAYVTSAPWIPVNPRVVAQWGRQWTRPENFVGNGPFTLREWKPNQHIIVTRRPDYWGADAIKLSAIQFLAFDNGDAEERAYRAGQIDVTMSVPFSKISAYAAQQPSPLRQIPLFETRYLAFNTQRPPLDDIRVRRALSLALDRESIVKHVLRGNQQAAYHFVPDGLGGFRSGTALVENATTARELLAAAGFPNGKGFPSLELTGWSQTPVLEAVQSMWKQQLGITVRIGVRDAKVHVAALEQGAYDIGFITAIPDVADAANLLHDLRSDSSGNYPHWQNAAFDALLKAADLSPTDEDRLAVLARSEALITEQCPLAPLYFNAKNILVRPTVQHWREDALWTRFYQGVALQQP